MANSRLAVDKSTVAKKPTVTTECLGELFHFCGRWWILDGLESETVPLANVVDGTIIKGSSDSELQFISMPKVSSELYDQVVGSIHNKQ